MMSGMSDAVSFQIQFLFEEVKGQRSNMLHAYHVCHVIIIVTGQCLFNVPDVTLFP